MTLAHLANHKVIASALALGLGFFLELSRPTPAQFAATVWPEALAGVKAELQATRDQSDLYQAVKSSNPLVRYFMTLLEAGKDDELDQLPAFWQAHTTAKDWIIASAFIYREETCRSIYIGAAGFILPVVDGCEVEPYRNKGEKQ